jgi:Ca2+-binding EF-hand superfamily protein
VVLLYIFCELRDESLAKISRFFFSSRNSKKKKSENLAAMAFRLSGEEIERCKEAFLKYDKDNSGSIDVWELRDILRSMGSDPSEEVSGRGMERGEGKGI